MTLGIVSSQAVLMGLGLAVAFLSLTVDIIVRLWLTAGEGGIDG